MTQRFERALAHVLGAEGGLADHPDDPGGLTNHGVTQRTYNGWRKQNDLEPRSVREITDPEVTAIYRSDFWEPMKGDKLPDGLAFVVFDGAVNSGVAQSVKWLQRALGVVDDGIVGSITLSAARDADVPAVIDDICDQRLAFMQDLDTWPIFGDGWSARVARVRVQGKAWARTGTVPTSDVPALPPEARPKAEGRRANWLKRVIRAILRMIKGG